MDMKRKIILWPVVMALVLAACGSQEAADGLQSGQQAGQQSGEQPEQQSGQQPEQQSGQQSEQQSGEHDSQQSSGLASGQGGESLTGSQGNAGGNAADAAGESFQDGAYMTVPEGQILEQSFEVTLDGWGEVTFASFWPEQDVFQKNGIWMYGDARFMLLKDGKAVYTFPEMSEDNGMMGQRFGQVISAAFRDYNEDGRKDVLLILEYAGVQGIDIGTAWREVRVYTQEEGEKDFCLDSIVSEYITRNTNAAWGEAITMEDVVQALEEYAGWYSAVTDISAWEVERFAASIRKEILSGDFKSLAQKIAFPIVIDGSLYTNREEFLSADFVKEPDKAFLETIEQASTQNLFCNWQGIMLGNGEVWFAEVSDATDSSAPSKLRIIAFNGISGQQDSRADAAGQQGGQSASADYWQLQGDALNARTEYYKASGYYQEIVDYWENVRGVRDIANQTDFLFATDSRYYTAEDFQEEPALVIHLAKNEIYARHGYIFEDPDLYNYFMGCVWYMPTTAAEDFDASVLNEYERENVKVLAGLDDF